MFSKTLSPKYIGTQGQSDVSEMPLTGNATASLMPHEKKEHVRKLRNELNEKSEKPEKEHSVTLK